MLNHLVKQVSEGDIQAIPPLLDELNDDPRRQRLMDIIGGVVVRVKRYRQEVTDDGSVDRALQTEWNKFFTYYNTWTNFKRNFDGLFWYELEQTPLVTILSCLVTEMDIASLQSGARYQEMAEARQAWYNDPANNIEDSSDEVSSEAPQGE